MKLSQIPRASGDVTRHEEKIIDLYNKHFSCAAIGSRLNLHSTAVSAFLRERGLLWLGKVGPEHPAWRGGETKKYGYPLIWKPDHPRSMRGKYVFKHLVVMEETIGRYISRDEPIHHIDLDRENASIDNLYLSLVFANCGQ